MIATNIMDCFLQTFTAASGSYSTEAAQALPMCAFQEAFKKPLLTIKEVLQDGFVCKFCCRHTSF